MNTLVYFLYGILALAVLALIVNIRFKLPKKLFLGLAVAILVFMCWFAMESPKPSPTLPQTPREPLVSLVSEHAILNPGENRFPLSINEPCKGASYLLYFASGKGDIPEEASPLDFSFVLCSADNDVLECSAVYFSGKALKAVFVFPENFDSQAVRFLKIVWNSVSPLDLEKISEEKILN
ncbi:MAG: hypothetical protein IKW49_08835 [Opitutales bacterium]|nr:hypothetical protein [Opitutales bacterium]